MMDKIEFYVLVTMGIMGILLVEGMLAGFFINALTIGGIMSVVAGLVMLLALVGGGMMLTMYIMDYRDGLI